MPDAVSNRRPGILAWLVFAPLVLWLMILVIAPTVVLVVYSFCDRDDDGQPVFQFTLDNYREIFEPRIFPVFGWMVLVAMFAAGSSAGVFYVIRGRFSLSAVRWGLLVGGGGFLSCAIRALPIGQATYLKIFWKTAELAGVTTLLCLVFGYPVGFFIARTTPAWRNRLLMLVMIPFWTSFLIRAYAWITILNQNGLLNALLRAMHLSILIPASGAVLYTPSAVVIGLVYAYLPFMILPIYGSIEKLDNSLIEAALDLGAGPIRTMLNVVFPLSMPGVVAGVLLVFVPAIGMFAVTDLMSGNAFPLLGSKIEEEFIGQGNNFPLGSALGVTLMAMFGMVFLATGFRKPRGIA